MREGLQSDQAATPAEPASSGRVRLDEELREAGITAGDIVETIHDPLVVLTPDLHTLLEEILPENDAFDGYEVAHEFEDLGERVMLLNARRLDHLQLILLVIVDITDRKQAEAALRAAKEEAEEAILVKSQFLATMSHELRTPLTGVIGLAELLETEVLGSTTGKQKASLSRIRGNAWHLVRIIDEILSYARSETGKSEVQREPVPVTQVVRDVVDMLEPGSDEHDVLLRLTSPDEPVFVVTDRGKLTQIVTNLVGEGSTLSLRLPRSASEGAT